MGILDLRGGIACDKAAYTCLFGPGSNVLNLLQREIGGEFE
jgi:hypothetical protein